MNTSGSREKGSPKKKKKKPLEFETTSFPIDGLVKLDINDIDEIRSLLNGPRRPRMQQHEVVLLLNKALQVCCSHPFCMDKLHNFRISKFKLNDNMTYSFSEFKRWHLELNSQPLPMFLPAYVASMADYLYLLLLNLKGRFCSLIHLVVVLFSRSTSLEGDPAKLRRGPLVRVIVICAGFSCANMISCCQAGVKMIEFALLRP